MVVSDVYPNGDYHMDLGLSPGGMPASKVTKSLEWDVLPDIKALG